MIQTMKSDIRNENIIPYYDLIKIKHQNIQLSDEKAAYQRTLNLFT